jgi:hypothetical protein
MSFSSSAMLARSMHAAPRLLGAVAGAVALALAGAAPALAEVPWWRVGVEVSPSYLPPGGEGEIVVAASDLGDGEAGASEAHPITITDRLPAGLTATAIASASLKCTLATLNCTYAGDVAPYQRLSVTIKVKVEEPPGTVTSLPDETSVEGGGAPTATSVQDVTVNGEPTPFGVEAQGYELGLLDEDGTPATQAGSHPFQITTTLVLNQTPQRGRQPVALPKDLRFALPPGLIGNPNAVAQCTMSDFYATAGNDEVNLCPPSSVVGVAAVAADEPSFEGVITKTVPVFNLAPSQGEPARLGFEVIGKIPIVIDTSVRTGGNYAVVASVQNATQTAGLLSSQVTLWGVPGDPRHNQARGWECVVGGTYAKQIGKSCPTSTDQPQVPFLTLPTSCASDPAAEPLVSSVEADSWAQPGSFLSAEYSWLNGGGEALGMEGCGQLPFTPALGVAGESHQASAPSGLSVDVRVPQKMTLEAEGLAEADVRDTTLRLPEGMQLNPSAANGLQACSEEQIGYQGVDAKTGMQEFTPSKGTPTQPLCPEASKVGVAHIKTPLLSHELEGELYLAEPAPNGEADKNPFDSLIALYLVAEDPVSGVLVKLAGKGELNQATGQLTTSFLNTPQLPFEELRVELFGGPRASVSTPAHCGEYASEAVFTPWSGTAPLTVASPAGEFDVNEGCGASPLAFAPSFIAQVTNTQAGAFAPFELEIARPDGDQALTDVTVELPPGVAAMLSSVTPCQEPPAGQEWACGPESLIGHSTASSGVGGEPVVLGGDVYLTSGYDGAPFGLLVATEAKAGPFDLGMVDVRSRINVNPQTAAVTITTDPGPRGEVFPTMLKGIPVALKRLQVSVDRPNFEFNPTSCDPMRIEGTLDGDEGASVGVSSPFQLGGCAGLPFAPKLTASAAGHGSKADGTTLDVNIQSPGLGQANIAKVDLQLPFALSSRLQTLQKACAEAAFNANPASCDEGSVIGSATVHTPVLKNPLSGPAYLVSHGGAAFPDVEFVLQGEGITLILDGKTDIKAGITYSKFESAPDAPFTSFQTELPAGPHSALTPNVPEKEQFSLCKTTLTMPTTITAQNGAVIQQNTNIALTGCGEVKSSKAKKLAKTQLLAKALKICRKKHGHKKKRRLACEKQARERYRPNKQTHNAKAGHKATKTASHRG